MQDGDQQAGGGRGGDAAGTAAAAAPPPPPAPPRKQALAPGPQPAAAAVPAPGGGGDPATLLTGELRPPPARGLLVALLRALAVHLWGAATRALEPRLFPTNQSCLLARAACHVAGDDIAPKFCRALGIADALTRLWPLSEWGARYAGEVVALRSAWFDARTRAALDAGATQVVLLAAGYDSSAYRLARPGVAFFEVDLPDVSAAKRALVAAALPELPAGALPAYVGADLAATPLAAALDPGATGFDPAGRTLWVAQGLMPYLPPEAVSRLLAGARGLSGPGSAFCLDLVNAAWCPAHPIACASLLGGVAARGEPFRCGVVDCEPATLAALGAAHGYALRRVAAGRIGVRRALGFDGGGGAGAAGTGPAGEAAAAAGLEPMRRPPLLHDVISCVEFAVL